MVTKYKYDIFIDYWGMHFIIRDKGRFTEEDITKFKKKIDFEAVNETIKIKKIEEMHAVSILNEQKLYTFLRKYNLYEIYMQKVKENKTYRKQLKGLIEKATKIRFEQYESWETGMMFIILRERVDNNIFNKLKKLGLFYHGEIDEDNEERFKGWCLGWDNSITQKIKFLKEGIYPYGCEE